MHDSPISLTPDNGEVLVAFVQESATIAELRYHKRITKSCK